MPEAFLGWKRLSSPGYHPLHTQADFQKGTEKQEQSRALDSCVAHTSGFHVALN